MKFRTPTSKARWFGVNSYPVSGANDPREFLQTGVSMATLVQQAERERWHTVDEFDPEFDCRSTLHRNDPLDFNHDPATVQQHEYWKPYPQLVYVPEWVGRYYKRKKWYDTGDKW